MEKARFLNTISYFSILKWLTCRLNINFKVFYCLFTIAKGGSLRHILKAGKSCFGYTSPKAFQPKSVARVLPSLLRRIFSRVKRKAMRTQPALPTHDYALLYRWVYYLTILFCFFSFINSFHCDLSQWHSSSPSPCEVSASVSFYRPLASLLISSSFRLGQFLNARVFCQHDDERRRHTGTLQIALSISRRPLTIVQRPALLSENSRGDSHTGLLL